MTLNLPTPPPHPGYRIDLAAESDLLSVLCLCPRLLPDIRANLREHHFFAQCHRDIYTSITECADQGTPIDCVSVTQRFRAAKRSEESITLPMQGPTGVAAYLASIIQVDVDPDDAPQLARQIRAEYRARETRAACMEAVIRLDYGEDCQVVLDGLREKTGRARL